MPEQLNPILSLHDNLDSNLSNGLNGLQIEDNNDNHNDNDNDNDTITTSNKNLLKKISYSGENDDAEEEEEDDDGLSLRSYQPTHSSDIDQIHLHPKFSRQISREDASSIIGGVNISSPVLNATPSSSKKLGKKSSFSNDWKLDSNSIDEISNTDSTEQSSDKFNSSTISQSNDNVQHDDSLKIFNFSLPFSTSSNDDVISFKTSQPSKNNYKKNNQHNRFHNEHFPLVSRTLRKLSGILPLSNTFSKKHQPHLLPKSSINKRAHHPKAPDPPPNVFVYWDHISRKVVPDEMADREDVRLKLERQQSLDTLQEARYYKDITSLDDGKFKALRDSLLPHPNTMLISQSISSKISQITTKARSESIDSPSSLSQHEMNNLNNLPMDSGNYGSSSINNNNTNNDKANLSLSPPIVSIQQEENIQTEMEIYDKLDGDILVIGGYRGSILRDSKTHRRTWIPLLKAGLNIRKVDLTIGPNDEDELREFHSRDVIFNQNSDINENDKEYPDMYPDGMLTHIGPVDISRKLLKKLGSNPKVNVKDWGYDWRLSLELTSSELYSDLVEIVNKQDEKKGVIIIAHSMGGLVAHGAMVKDPSLIRSIIYVGTPMPCCNILGPLRFSDSILLSRDVLTHEANFFMRSSFVFVPPSWGGEDENGKGGGMCLFRDLQSGKRYMIDFWNVKNWVYYNLSPLVSSVRLKHDVKSGILDLNTIKDKGLKHKIKEYLKIKINPETELIVLDEISKLHQPAVSWLDSYIYLERTLARTKSFIKTLERKDDVIYPPMAQIFSNGVPSVKYSLVDGEESIKRGEYYKFFYGPGDGVAYQGWLFPRDRGRKRLDSPDLCGEGSIDRIADVPDWRGREYGYGSKYAFDLCGRFRSTSGHLGLLGDLGLMGKALIAVTDEERKRVSK